MTNTTTQSALARRSNKMKWPAVAVVVSSALFVTGMAAPASAVTSAPVVTPTINLASVQQYSILTATTATDVGAATTLSGSIGSKTAYQGFDDAKIKGAANVGNDAYKAAMTDLNNAYDDGMGRVASDEATAAADLGKTFTPGVHKFDAAVTMGTPMTLDGQGQANPVFIFQIKAAFSSSPGAKMNLINGANGSRVFFLVAGAVSLAANTPFNGTLIGASTIAVGTGSAIIGRTLATANSISTNTNTYTSTPPVIKFDGGANTSTNNAIVTVTGTTDGPPGTAITVTGLGSPIKTSVNPDGTWSATSGTLKDGTYTAVASITDVNGITTDATTKVTVKTSAPLMKINNGPSQTTDATRPTIAGSTNVPDGAIVTVIISDSTGKGTTIKTAVSNNGLWSVFPATPLADGSYRISATITDAANNTGSSFQTLIVNTTGQPTGGDNGGSTGGDAGNGGSTGGTGDKATFINGGNSRTAPAGSAFTITGTGPANSIVTLHFHKRGTAANDYSIARDVKVDANGMWSRAIAATIDYRYFATGNGQTSNNVLLQLV